MILEAPTPSPGNGAVLVLHYPTNNIVYERRGRIVWCRPEAYVAVTLFSASSLATVSGATIKISSGGHVLKVRQL